VRSALLEAARELFEEKGYAGATTREIADRAGVNEGLIFRHFECKANLFSATMSAPLSEMLSAFMASPDAGDASLFISRMIAFLRQNRQLLMALVAAQAYEQELGGAPSLHAFFAESLAEVRLHPRLSLEPAIEPEQLLQTIRYGFASVVGVLLLEDWVFGAAREQGGICADSLGQFIEYGMYGLR